MIGAIYSDKQKLQDAERLLGFTVKQDIGELVATLPGPDVITTPRILGFYTSYLMTGEYDASHSTPTLPSSEGVLKTGVRDAAQYITDSLEMIPHPLTYEQALRLAKHPDSIQSIAVLAMRPEDGEEGLAFLLDHPNVAIRLTEDYSAIHTGLGIEARSGGCPAAGNSTSLEIKPTRLFRHFAEWSEELALRTLHYRS